MVFVLIMDNGYRNITLFRFEIVFSNQDYFVLPVVGRFENMQDKHSCCRKLLEYLQEQKLQLLSETVS